MRIFLLYLFVFFGLFACGDKESLPQREIYEIREIGELSTTEFVFSKVLKIDDEGEWYKFGDRKILISCKAKVKAGFDLTKKNYRIAQNADTIWLHFPKAKLLDVNVNPLLTEVFQESGIWNDVARQKLMNKAKTRIVKDVNKAELTQKAEKSMSDLILQLVSDQRQILIYYE